MNDKEMYELIIRYVKERRGTDITIEELRSRYPRHELIGWYWDALSYYRIDGWCRALREVELTEGAVAFVRIKKGKYRRYHVWEGAWEETGELDESMYK